MQVVHTTLLVVALVAVGCSGQVSDGVGPGGGGADGGAGGGIDGSSGGGGGDAGGAALACKKVDLVFSVDDSDSMQEEMDAMRNDVFPAFAQALLEIGGGLDDYRIGVIDACPRPATMHTRGDGGECNFSSGKNWMDSNSPNLVSEFACVGNIYSGDNDCSGDNDDEQPASAAAASLGLAIVSPGGANVDFLRDDALLVVIAITDEDEQPTPLASANAVYQRLVAVKGGDASRIVFLGIGGSHDCSGVYGGAEQATLLSSIAQEFAGQSRGLFWDLCEGQLEDGLGAAMEVIDSACDDFCTDPDGCDRNPPGGCTTDADCGDDVTVTCEGGVCVGIVL